MYSGRPRIHSPDPRQAPRPPPRGAPIFKAQTPFVSRKRLPPATDDEFYARSRERYGAVGGVEGGEGGVLVGGLPGFGGTEVSGEKPAKHTQDEVRVEVKEHTYQKGTLSGKVVGTVRNTSKSDADYVRVIAMGENKRGEIVFVFDAFVTEKKLAPGAESGFSIMTLGETEPSTTWELFAERTGKILK